MEKKPLYATAKTPDAAQSATLLKVAPPALWAALGAVAILFFSAALWVTFGVMAVKVEGVGMIIDSAGVANIAHSAEGRVAEILVIPGSRIAKGDLVAKFDQPLATGRAVIARHSLRMASDGKDAAERAAIYDTKEHEADLAVYATSPYDGIVDEIKVNEGAFAAEGTPLMSVRLDQERGECVAVLYVALENGKRVRPGMTVQLAPSGVDPAESGALLGVVRSVSQYPVSAAGMEQLLGNAQVVGWILGKLGGAAMEVHIDLVEDAENDTGYLWSSVVGKPQPVTPGSACEGLVIVERRTPAEKFFYGVSQWLRNR